MTTRLAEVLPVIRHGDFMHQRAISHEKYSKYLGPFRKYSIRFEDMTDV